ncbi:substrate-binding domain-containing protein [Pseudomonas monteilii]|uniref:substrate-binding domain-containing protein n=1 Tax=Pseudomonas monteilii TaxID=76759 RepID=UPI0015FB3503|nr:substrate-binding domain-containing protein [Pseudomonas monteilii]MBA6090141.1 substrate-binding domain-containing protein [Pseudomonas monteilii]
MSALGVMNAAEEGIAIPGTLSLVGLDDIAIASVAPISLTTIAHNRRGMGGAAATLLMQAIKKEAPEPGVLILPMTLVVRRTTSVATNG